MQLLIANIFDILFGRHLLGDELGPLNIDELEHLELQLDTSLKHIKSTRVSKL